MNTGFEPIAKSSLADELAQRVTQMIQERDYDPGDRLPTINDMAGRFGVGHPTLREALKKLETLGVVRIKHGSGVYVGKNEDVLLMSNPIFAGEVSKQMMIDLIEARVPIELKSVKLAAQHATGEHLERMEGLLVEAGQHLDNDAGLSTANMSFHRQVAVASGNVVMAQMLEVLGNLFEHEQRTILDIHGSRERHHAEHLGILEALREHDSSLAEERMSQHLEGVRKVLLQWDPDQHPLQ